MLDPTRYPFPQAPGSYVLVRSEVLPVEAIDPASLAEWIVQGRRRLGDQCDEALLARRRVPLLAYGSNGSPEVLERKLGAEAFVPVVQATLHDFDIVYSAHISPYGSVPAALYPSRRTSLDVCVLLVDDRQLATLDETEPNYARGLLAAGDSLRIDGVPIRHVYLYATRHGVLREGNEPVAVAEMEAEERQVPAMGQEEVLERVRVRLGETDKPLDEFNAESRDPAVARARTAKLKVDALHMPAATDPSLPSLRVGPTETQMRGGAPHNYIVAVRKEHASELGLGEYAVLTRDVSDGLFGLHRLATLCRVVFTDALEEEEDVAADQSLRTALGIAFEREAVDAARVGLHPVRPQGWKPRRERKLVRWLGWRYLLMRVGKADIPDMEKQYARIPADAFALLGSSSGDQLRVESVVRAEDGSYEIRDVSARAYALTDEVLERRESLAKAYFGARFLDPVKALGVDPDVSPIYLDAADRQQLGVAALDIVTVRRNLRHLLGRELREFGIMFFLAVLGIHALWNSLWVVPLSLLVAVALSVANLRARAGVR